MFRRGQRIVIGESSVFGRSHPAKGDMGYLNNMYFFYKDRFILIDAYFFAYKPDLNRGSARCEKKKFIIDLGMSGRFKRRLKSVGIRKSWFSNNKCVVNLSSAGHWNRADVTSMGMVDLPPVHGSYGMWPLKLKDDSNKLCKIPFGQISVAPGRYSLHRRPWKEIECWMHCIYPLLNTQLISFSPEGDHSLHRKVRTIYGRLDGYIYDSSAGDGSILFKFSSRPSSPDRTIYIIDSLKQVQILSEIFLNNLDVHAVKTLKDSPETAIISSAWKHLGFFGLSEGTERVPNYCMEALIAIFIRSILFSGSIEKRLMLMGRYVPWSDKKIISRVKKFNRIRREANNNSAALARIYEEELLD